MDVTFSKALVIFPEEGIKSIYKKSMKSILYLSGIRMMKEEKIVNSSALKIKTPPEGEPF